MTTQINLTFFLGSHYEKFKANQGFYGGAWDLPGKKYNFKVHKTVYFLVSCS